MSLQPGEIITVEINNDKLTLRVEDTSKSESVSGRVETVLQGDTYKVGQVCEFERAKLKLRD